VPYSSAYSLSAAFPSGAFRIGDGATVIGGLRGATQHHHCPARLTWMFTRPEGMDFLLNVRSALLDDVETCTDGALLWAQTPAVHSYARFPPVAYYERLTREFTEATGDVRRT